MLGCIGNSVWIYIGVVDIDSKGLRLIRIREQFRVQMLKQKERAAIRTHFLIKGRRA
ncbi:hypothetical protein D3C81_2036280 [compost metagenome]